MSQHHFNSKKENADLWLAFFFLYFFFHAFIPQERGRLWFFPSSLHRLHYMPFFPPPLFSPFNLPYLMQHYLFNLAKLCVSKLKFSFCLPFRCYLHSFVFSAAYPVNLLFPFTPECWGSFFYSYVCLSGLSSAVSFPSFYSHLVSKSYQVL